MGARIFANHAHLLPPSLNPNANPDRLLKLLDACGIEGAVCFAPFSYQMPDADPNQWLLQTIAPHKRLHGFATLDFARPNLNDQVRRIADLGFPGIKLHPNAQNFDILGPPAFEAYAAAQDHNLLLTFHTGIHHARLKDHRVINFDEIAHHFPNLRFTLEHMGGYHFFNEALAVLINRFPPPWVKNQTCKLFAGLASVFTQHQNRFWYLRPDQIMEIILQTSIDQVIFGLDFPYNLEKETRIALDTINSLPLSDPDKAQLLGGNLRRELGID